ncbi:glycosyltransferase family 2 protein [Nitrospiraceae bacterium AH_259_D15_M11_P09]|nr:glycosyltransferase family 2 protein [Nitrospiraceae bacterium AH_259_D15_M11_P09]
MPRSDSPQVSVVIPVYNGERYLAEAIQSVVGQTYRDFELIVVDDGSTDGSALVARSFGDAVRYYYQKNGGLSKARNAGIALARATYIAFLDHDDLWMPHKLVRQVDYLNGHPDAGVVYSQCHVIKKGKVPSLLYSKPVEQDPFSIIRTGRGLQMSGPMFRKSVLEKVGGFDEAFRSAIGYEDTDMTIRLADVTTFAYVPEVLVLYRVHENNFCNINSPTKSRIHIHNRGVYLHKCLSRYQHDPRISRFLYRQMVGYYAELGNLQIKDGHLPEGRSSLLKAIRLSLLKRASAKNFVRTFYRLLRSYVSLAQLF